MAEVYAVSAVKEVNRKTGKDAAPAPNGKGVSDLAAFRAFFNARAEENPQFAESAKNVKAVIEKRNAEKSWPWMGVKTEMPKYELWPGQPTV
ncbi:MAG: hypothetical protein WCY41_04480 [Candidatus Micrarchaeia archaeon]